LVVVVISLLLFKIVDLQNTLEQNMCTREIAKFKHVMAPAAIEQIQSKNKARTSEETADRTINNNLATERDRGLHSNLLLQAHTRRRQPSTKHAAWRRNTNNREGGGLTHRMPEKKNQRRDLTCTWPRKSAARQSTHGAAPALVVLPCLSTRRAPTLQSTNRNPKLLNRKRNDTNKQKKLDQIKRDSSQTLHT
jgi:hypothetical protein